VDTERFRERYLQGLKLREIGEEFNMDARRVFDLARKLGLPKRQRGSSGLPGRTMQDLYLAGQDLRQIARAVGSNAQTVRRVLLQRGVELRDQRKRVFNETTTEIIRLYRTGRYTYKDLARMFNMRPNMVGHRVRRILGPSTRPKSS